MKNAKWVSISVFLLFCLTTNAFSQGYSLLHFGPSFPSADFASDDIKDEKAGGAGMGVNLGLQYVYPFSESGLGFFGGIDINYNGLKRIVKDDIEEKFANVGVTNANYSHYKYLNIPLSAGLNYALKAEGKVIPFVNIGLTANFLKITNMVITHDNKLEVSRRFDLANRIGLKVGGGVLINDKTSVSIDYLGLGVHEITGNTINPAWKEEDFEGKLNVSLMALTLGFKI